MILEKGVNFPELKKGKDFEEIEKNIFYKEKEQSLTILYDGWSVCFDLKDAELSLSHYSKEGRIYKTAEEIENILTKTQEIAQAAWYKYNSKLALKKAKHIEEAQEKQIKELTRYYGGSDDKYYYGPEPEKDDLIGEIA